MRPPKFSKVAWYKSNFPKEKKKAVFFGTSNEQPGNEIKKASIIIASKIIKYLVKNVYIENYKTLLKDTWKYI